MRLLFQTRGAERQASRLTTLAHRIDHPAGGLHAAADELRQQEKRRFVTRGGGTWKPNRPSTVRQKGNARVLVMTGALERSLTQRHAPGSVERVQGSTLLFGTARLASFRFVVRRRPLFGNSGRQIASRFATWLLEGVE